MSLADIARRAPTGVIDLPNSRSSASALSSIIFLENRRSLLPATRHDRTRCGLCPADLPLRQIAPSILMTLAVSASLLHPTDTGHSGGVHELLIPTSSVAGTVHQITGTEAEGLQSSFAASEEVDRGPLS